MDALLNKHSEYSGYHELYKKWKVAYENKDYEMSDYIRQEFEYLNAETISGNVPVDEFWGTPMSFSKWAKKYGQRLKDDNPHITNLDELLNRKMKSAASSYTIRLSPSSHAAYLYNQIPVYIVS